MTHPEDAIIAEIDALIDSQLERGPHDDYNSDYYPKCGCGHDWHGLTCAGRGCTCTEYREPVPSKRVARARDLLAFDDEHGTADDQHSYIDDETYDGRPGYTLADIERLRWHRNPILPARRTIRLSQRNLDGSVDVIEGFFDLLTTSLNQQHVSVCFRVYPIRHEVRDGLVLGAADHPARMIAIAGGTPDGFVPLGYLHPEDIDVETDRVMAVSERYQAWETLERYQVTMRINAEFSEPLLRRLGFSP